MQDKRQLRRSAPEDGAVLWRLSRRRSSSEQKESRTREAGPKALGLARQRFVNLRDNYRGGVNVGGKVALEPARETMSVAGRSRRRARSAAALRGDARTHCWRVRPRSV